MGRRRRIRWDRVLIVFGPILLLIILLCVKCHHGDDEDPGNADPGTVESMTVSESAPDSAAQPAQSEYRDLVLVVDAGHGGNDTGTNNQAETRFEKDDNLRLSLAVEDALNRYPHVQVIMTRETDVYVDLQERCDIANNANADFFLSLHRNSASAGNGVEIWINNDSAGDVAMDKLMAEYIMEWLEQVGISNNRGIKKGLRNTSVEAESENYYVNRFTNMPSCLVEMGFMTSELDNSNFDTKLNEYADAIAGAVMELVTDKGIYTEQHGVPASWSTTTRKG